MQLYVTKPSPYARKAWAAVLELGLEDQVEIIELEPRMPTVAKPDLEPINPLGKVPTLVIGDGQLILDSAVIVAYLNQLASGNLIPEGPERWRALTLEALANGCMDAGIVLRVESLKAEAKRDEAEIAAYTAKIDRTLDMIEQDEIWLAQPFTVGALSLVCVLDWFAFRQILPDPLGGRPRLAGWLAGLRDRPSLAATRPR
jgi:glutathione S-transferase